MSYIRLVFLLLVSSNYILGFSKLPFCQCECCPGDQCESQLLIFSIDKCNETTCSFEQCHKMYPKKCGLIPGFTNSSCNGINDTPITTTPTNSSDYKITLITNTTSTNIIFPIIILINLIFCLIFS